MKSRTVFAFACSDLTVSWEIAKQLRQINQDAGPTYETYDINWQTTRRLYASKTLNELVVDLTEPIAATMSPQRLRLTQQHVWDFLRMSEMLHMYKEQLPDRPGPFPPIVVPFHPIVPLIRLANNETLSELVHALIVRADDAKGSQPEMVWLWGKQCHQGFKKITELTGGHPVTARHTWGHNVFVFEKLRRSAIADLIHSYLYSDQTAAPKPNGAISIRQ
jgi:hypothetical protein